MCNYLKKLPHKNTFGLNKVLIVRQLTIDFKNRQSEFYLKTPENFPDIDHKHLNKYRSQVLRNIFNISRTIFKEIDSNKVRDLNILKLYHLGQIKPNIYLDFITLINNKDILNKIPEKDKLIIFSNKVPEKDMMKFFVKYNLPLPKSFRLIKNTEELIYLSSLSAIIDDKFSELDDSTKKLWMYNLYLYNGKGGIITFKTNNEIKI